MGAKNEYYYGEEVNLSFNMNQGYTFNHWDEAADGSGADYAKSDPITGKTANFNLYARWDTNSYSITYKDKGNVAFSGSHVDTPNTHPTSY